MRLPRCITRRLPCQACRPIRQQQTLRIVWPIQVYLEQDGARFLCHKCGRTGPIDRSSIPKM